MTVSSLAEEILRNSAAFIPPLDRIAYPAERLQTSFIDKELPLNSLGDRQVDNGINQISTDALLHVWLSAPAERRAAAYAALTGEDTDQAERFLSLKDVAAALGYKHYTSLWKLGVKSVADNFGGRPRYRRSRVLEYLRSDACAKRRQELREIRHTKERGNT